MRRTLPWRLGAALLLLACATPAQTSPLYDAAREAGAIPANASGPSVAMRASTFEHKLTAPDAASSDRFGNSVSLSGDRALVGANGEQLSGSAYAFRLPNFYVDAAATGVGDGSSWDDAFTSLQTALAAASPGDQIWVARGTYTPDEGTGQTDGDRTASFGLKSGVAVYGGFAGTESALDERDIAANPTILSGDLDQNDGPDFANNADNAYHVVTADGVDDTALLDGVTVTAGNASGTFQLGYGGGIYVTSASPSLARLTVTGNTSAIRGGGVYFSSSSLTLTASTVSGNTSRSGGGLYAAGGGSFPLLTLGAVTVTGNHATDTQNGGGGLVIVNGDVVVSNSTITDNTTDGTVGGIIVARGGATLTNTILYGNSGQGGATAAAQVLFSNEGTLALNTSVVQGGVPAGATNGGGNRAGDSLLGPLADNGGPTPTHLPMLGSSAIDIGGTCGPTDQRGLVAPQDGDARAGVACDAGAVEVAAPEPLMLVVTTTADTGDGVCDPAGTGDGCTLREAILAANAAPTADVITFATGVQGTIGLTGALPALSSRIDLQGPGADRLTVRRESGGDYRVFHVTTSGETRISGLTISNGLAQGSNTSERSGGGIFNDGATLTLDRVTVRDNEAIHNGGGIHSIGSGTLTVTGSTISDNTAGHEGVQYDGVGGGGIYASGGELLVDDSIVSGNRGYRGGGIRFVQGRAVHVTRSQIFGNTATLEGGGIWAFLGRIYIDHSSIYDNSVTTSDLTRESGSGGGIWMGGLANYLETGEPMGIFRSSIYENSVPEKGGGIYAWSMNLFLQNVTVAHNSASDGGGVYVEDGNDRVTIIDNGTIAYNTASRSGGAGGLIMACPGGCYNEAWLLISTITWGNSNPEGVGSEAQIATGFDPATGSSNGWFGTRELPFSVTQNTISWADITTIADPLLGPLQDNGGPTPTMLPGPGSSAVDFGTSNGTLQYLAGSSYEDFKNFLASREVTDQRGLPRSVDFPGAPNHGDGDNYGSVFSDASDAGAVERQFDDLGPSQPLAAVAGWRMLATPSTGATVGGFLDPLWTQCFDGADYNGPACAGSAPNVYRYDEAVAGDLGLGYVAPASAAEALAAGTGLFVYGYTDGPGALPQTLEPTGAEPEAPFAFSLSYTDNGDQPSDAGWNLVGNPFLVGLDWDEVTRTDVSEAVYVYDPVTDDYLTYSAGVGGNLGGVVPSVVAAYQGFWVQATAEAPAIEAPASARVSNGAFQGRTASTSAPAVELVVSGTVGDATLGDIVRVAHVEGATLGVDDADAYELSGFGAAALDVFAVAEGPDGPVALDISAVPPDVTEVDLDVRASGADASVEVVMTWPEVSVEGPVVLVDRQTGEEIDLRAASVYRFTVDVADVRTTTRLSVPRPLRVGAETARRSGGGRFALRFGTLSVDAGDDVPTETALGLARPNPTSGGARLTLSLAEAGAVRAEVYDALGRRVAVVTDGELGVGRHELAIPSQALAPGTYVVRVVAGDQVLTRRLSVVR